MNRVLVVSGESPGNQNIMMALSRVQCSPLLALDLAEGQQILAQEKLDLVVVDLNLSEPGDPQMAEFGETCRATPQLLVILALIPTAELERYNSLIKFDDFVLSPYRPPEVAIRAQHLLRRIKPADESAVIRNGDLVIDPTRYEVTLDGKRVDLTFKEYELLRFLGSSPGKVFTRETLLNRVWGYDYFGGTRTVDVHVRRLRTKIETATTAFIETVRNVGYRFREVP